MHIKNKKKKNRKAYKRIAKICLLVLFFIGAYIYENFSPSYEERDDFSNLRVASWNLENFCARKSNPNEPNKSHYSLSQIFSQIAKINPDVIFFQEISNKKMLLYIRDSLRENQGINYDFYSITYGLDPYRRLAYLSKKKPFSTKVHKDFSFLYNGRKSSVKRGFLELNLKGENGEVLSMYNVHLKAKSRNISSDKTGQLYRQKEICELFKIIDKSKYSKNIIIMGDFNSLPDETLIGSLNNRFSEIKLRDKNGENWTFIKRNYAKSIKFCSQLDYIFCSQNLKKYVKSARIGKKNDGSDHRIIYADINWTF